MRGAGVLIALYTEELDLEDESHIWLDQLTGTMTSICMLLWDDHSPLGANGHHW